MSKARAFHEPVLQQEVVGLLLDGPAGTIVDGTVGTGGHTEALLLAAPKVRVIGIDRDPDALSIAKERLSGFGKRILLVHADYRDAGRVLDDLGEDAIDGLLLDLGISSLQLDRPERGFSFRHEAPLDMRMDRSQGGTASEWLAASTEAEIARVLREYGEERYAGRIARAIVRTRKDAPIDTTWKLSKVVYAAVPRAYFAQRIDPATRTFQAVRIAVND
jgi:16S rRNA (cytosine1402-N4)-methyltransferase